MSFKRSIAAAIALATALMGLALAYGYTRWEVDRRAAYWVDHAHRVIEATLTLFPQVQDVVLSEQTFLDGDGRSSLTDYQGAEQALRRTEVRLSSLVADDPAQTARVAQTNEALDRWLNGLDEMIRLGQQGRADEARRLIAAGTLRAPITRARQGAARVAAAEQDLLNARIATAGAADRLSFGIALALALLALAGLVAMIIELSRANLNLRRSGEARDASDALMEALFSNIPDYLMILDVDASDQVSIADVNPSLARAFEASRPSVRGRRLEDLFTADLAGRLTAHYLQVRDTAKPARTRGPVMLPGGERIWEAIVAPVGGRAGAPARIVGAIRDVTDQVKAEARLREGQRLDAVGQLTGGVAHEFNNLLQVILGNLELLLPFAENDPVARRRLDHAIQGANQAARLTSRLLAFARRQALAPEVIDLAVLTRDMSDLLRHILGASIQVECQVADTLWPVLIDPSQVETAILNLALNARAAMPTGGRLTLRVENCVLAAEAAADLDLTGGEFILMAISDTGEGMSPDVLKRAVEPFFTTRTGGQGSGLGLSMTYGFVRQSHGAMRLESRLKQGTSVRIWLPRATDMQVLASTAETVE